MRIAIVNGEGRQALTIKGRILEVINEDNLQMDQENPNLVISIGGDGTLLHAFHAYENLLDQVRFVGIHTGHLGFYTDWLVEELDEFIHALLADRAHGETDSVSYPLLEVAVTRRDGRRERYLALNESAIRRYEGTMTTEVFIGKEHFELFKGDGLCLSTPTGSTGLNKSLGGAVVHPRLDAIQLTEIASINNRVYRTLSSSMLFPSDEYVTIIPQDGQMSGVTLSIDHEIYQAEDVEKIIYRVAKERVHFARYRHTHFWDRVKNSFISNIDSDK
ncbi:NAD kinase [Aerococcus kribbianus]|uniref:NAD kinase n=1 Tax=Aerococcus kribbianus TaxID=2999064 RepID=A0A9X3JDQ0_9LACT|nr:MULTISPECIES: NAD kinase [unclassified Aerococcus]MCZ0717740.1 NAD kinase [Aerococcus sp. YH-aer221]MCZ0726028.1 NAD kinase [Aerococcus sp. YH-aer222]